MKITVEGDIDLKRDDDHYYLVKMLDDTRDMLQSYAPKDVKITKHETVAWIVRSLETVHKFQKSFLPTVKKFSKHEGEKIG